MTLIGRRQELAQLRQHLRQRQHTLVVGPVGIGKSALLRTAMKGRKRVLRLPRLWPLTGALLSMARHLQAQGRLELPDFDSQYLDWAELKPKLTGLSAEELLERLAPLVKQTVLLVDDFDGLTPESARQVEPLFEVALLMGAVTVIDLRPELSRFFWHFRLLPLEPLGREASRALLWCQADPSDVPDAEVFEQHVLDTAGGNPLAIRELARQTHRIPMRNPDHIRQLHHEAGIHYVDLTPVLLLVGAGAVVLRFLALGLNDIEAYILAGSFGACFLAGRYFIYRAMRGRR